MKKINPPPRGLVASVLVVLACILYPGVDVSAQQEAELSDAEIIAKANHLRALLNDLLSNPNTTSIKKNIEDGGEVVESLMYKAEEQKIQGEALLNEEQYLEAAMHFQSALEYVVRAIRVQQIETDEPPTIKAKLQQQFKTNQTFISAATRVVMSDANAEAVKLLEMAKQARLRAEADSTQGKDQEAMIELENSTRLAKQAIILVRQGKVIERKSE